MQFRFVYSTLFVCFVEQLIVAVVVFAGLVLMAVVEVVLVEEQVLEHTCLVHNDNKIAMIHHLFCDILGRFEYLPFYYPSHNYIIIYSHPITAYKKMQLPNLLYF